MPEGADTPVKSVTIVEPAAEAQPPAPAHPSSAPPSVNVFDFLVPSDSPHASKTNLAAGNQANQAKKMERYDPKLAGSSVSIIESSAVVKDDPEYEKRGFSYGSGTIPATQKRERPKVEYVTPSAKDLLQDLEASHDRNHSNTGKSTDKKRKRHNVEDLDLTSTRQRSHDSDAIMSDAPPAPSFSTGLTGGLNRLLSKSDKSRHDDDHDMDDPPSPIKRSRPTSTYHVEKGRTSSRPSSIAPSGGPPSSALVRVKARRSSSEDRPRKHHRSYHSDAPSTSQNPDDTHKPHGDSHRQSLPSTTSSHHTTTEVHRPGRHRSHSRSTSTARGTKALEYKPHRRSLSDIDSSNEASTSTQPRSNKQALVLYRSRAELFASFVTKGPDSEAGCSVNKALKRYHRERAALRGREGQHTGREEKGEEERELWKEVRLRRNERGEIVLFF